MSQSVLKIRRALLSVSDKTDIIPFALKLQTMGVELISTGGTAECLARAGVATVEVSDFTQFPEIMGGRIKTLHPRILAGVLGRRDVDASQAQDHQIEWIDLIVCNLYPFLQTMNSYPNDIERCIENIDIGGVTLLRAAAKNFAWTCVVVDVADYVPLMDELELFQGVPLESRKKFAAKAFAHTAQYDALIAHFLTAEDFPAHLSLPLQRHQVLRYGENPHQRASGYVCPEPSFGILQAAQRQGKELSYNNILDADAGLQLISEFDAPACVVIKHATPCGVARAESIDDAFYRAWHADSLSAFGGIVVINRPCTPYIADMLKNLFVEVLVTEQVTPELTDVLASKPNMRVLELRDMSTFKLSGWQYRSVVGGMLVQHYDNFSIDVDQLACVTVAQPTSAHLQALKFAWTVAKHVKSNGIVIAQRDSGLDVTLGIASGHVSRIDAVHTALSKISTDHEVFEGAVLASDGFFPFRDSIDAIAKTSIRAIVQPGGSRRDQEVIAACDEYGIAMLLTKIRCFKH